MPRSLQREEEKEHLIQSQSIHDRTDSLSIRSFASSSSTLANSPITSTDLDEEKSFGLLAQEIQDFPIQKHHQSWLKTPLSIRGILFLLIFRLPPTIFRPLLPSFLFTSPARKLHPTSYLDGLRGVAALIVYLDHFVLNWYYPLRNGYLSSPTDTHILQLPIIRLILGGRASVGIFFVISGFVLSYKPLLQIRSSNHATVLTTLSSSIFRRSMRFYLPIVAGTFISMNLAYYGLFTPVPSRGELIPPTLPSYKAQLHHWWFYTLELVFPFWEKGVDPNRAYGPPYNGHLWTIPLEFYGSMVVFLCVLGMSRARHAGVRMGVLAGLAGWCLRRGRWDGFSFLGGVVLAEWSFICSSSSSAVQEQEDVLPLHQEESSDTMEFETQTETRISIPYAFLLLLKPLRVLRKPLNFLLLFLSLYLLSYAGESPSPGYYHTLLITYTPTLYESIFLGREHYWLSLGSVLLIFTLTNSPFLQKPFTSSLAQYLGDISYSLYICHGMVLFTIGTWMQDKWTGQVGEEKWVDNGFGEQVEAVVRVELMEVGSWGFFKAWVLTGCVCTVVVFWGVDLFWRGVDRGSVRLGRWIEGVLWGGERWSKSWVYWVGLDV